MSRATRSLLTRRPAWFGLMGGSHYEQKQRIFQLLNYSPHKNQQLIHESNATIRAICCGRRFGKSTLAAAEAVFCAIMGGGVWAVAPDYELSSIVFEEALNMVLSSPLKNMLVAEPRMARGRQAMIFESGGWILGKSSHKPRSLLGRGLDLVIYDEAATEPNGEIYHQYLLPVVLDRGGSIVLISTPRGDNWFRDIWEKGAHGQPGHKSWQFSTRDNPMISEEAFVQLSDGYPADLWRQEFLAVFLDNVGALFKGYRDVSTGTMLGADCDPDSIFPVIGIDYGRLNDYTVICVFDALSGRELFLYRFGGMHMTLIFEQIIRICEMYPDAPILFDATGPGDPVCSQLETYISNPITPFIYTNRDKMNILNQMAVAIQDKEIELLGPDVTYEENGREVPIGKIALSEMSAFRYERTGGGKLTANAPPGKHDDIVNARALALECCYRNVGRRRDAGTMPPERQSEPLRSMTGEFSNAPAASSSRAQNFKRGRFKRP